MTYKTPGVFVKEVSTFPPSVAAVPTAIPAFIGYTQNTEFNNLDLINRPVRIESFPEFKQIFGEKFIPFQFIIQVKGHETEDSAVVMDVKPQAGPSGSERAAQYYLYDCLELFYDNGGGSCFIVSVGSYNDPIDYDDLSGGLKELKKVDEPTLLLFPDAVGLTTPTGQADVSGLGNLQKLALAQCANLKDRFVVMDVMGASKAPSISFDPVQDFRDAIGINDLNYGAVYYPWIVGSINTPIDFDKLVFQDDSDPPVDITNVELGGLSSDDDENALFTTFLEKQNDTAEVVNNISDEVNSISKDNFDLNAYYESLANLFLSPDSGTPPTEANFTSIMTFLRSMATAFPQLELETGSLSEGTPLRSKIDNMKSKNNLKETLATLISIEKNTDFLASGLSPTTPADLGTIYANLEMGWLPGTGTIASVDPDDTIDIDNTASLAEQGTAVLTNDLFKNVVQVLVNNHIVLFELALREEKQAMNTLFEQHFFFRNVAQAITLKMASLPPSAAVAGIYAKVDNTRGVWKAPANVSLTGISGPAFKITNKQQDDLNIHITGKSVNAIRNFTGKGTLVWGSRTLDGNDNEWKYVSVRRFFIFAEESIKKATEQFVFEPNDANTWVKVRGMIENFLRLQWRQGALVGAKPEDAFYVKVGIGETMTAQDILEGRMIVEIGMAVVRPAEFIILRFSHKMQVS
jgi:phage tail sheath protein FI